MAQLLHITERAAWQAAERSGEYCVSTRGITLEEQGFIHCSPPHQLRAVAESWYGDAVTAAVPDTRDATGRMVLPEVSTGR